MSGNRVARRGGRDLERPYGPSALLAPDNSGSVIMEDAWLIFRNFKGEEKQYNREGDRNFCVVLDPEIAEAMLEDGWNIKQLKSRDDEPGDYYVQVSVGYKGRPPRIVLLSSKGRVELSEHEVELLDWIDIQKADLIIRPYKYDVNGSKGIKAYTKTLFVTMNEDYFELKYSDVPEAGSSEGLPELEAGSQNARVELDEDGNEVFIGELVD